MKPILYYDDRSPPVRSCLMLIKYMGIDVDLHFVDLFNREHLTEDFLKINPLHTVPTLKDKDIILTDSHAILIYLSEKYGAGFDLFPQKGTIRALIINRLFFECSILFRRNSDMMIEIIHKKTNDVSHYKDKIHEAYSFLEKFLTEDNFIAYSSLTLADISVVTTLSSMNLVFPVTSEWPKLKYWFEQMRLLPSYMTANEPGLNKMKQKLKEYANFDVDKIYEDTKF